MVECPAGKLAGFFVRGQYSLRLAFIAIAWFCVALGIYRLVPLPGNDDESIYGYWRGSAVFIAWIGVGIGAIFRSPILCVLCGLMGAFLGYFFAVLSVQ